MTPPPNSPFKIWLFMVLLALGPFLLKTGLDLEVLQRQAVTEIYRQMRFQSPLSEMPLGSSIRFETQREKSLLESTFKNQLGRDFKLVEIGEFPRVRIFFESSKFLHARIDVELPQKPGVWTSWESSERFVNNGILLGFWLGVLVFLLQRNWNWSLGAVLFLTAFWKSDWNFIALPNIFYKSMSTFFRELSTRIGTSQWSSFDMGTLLEACALLSFSLAIFAVYFRKRILAWHSGKMNLLLSFLFEPFLLYVFSSVAGWGVEVSWWKLYFGSMLFRYLLFSHLFFSFLNPGYLDLEQENNYMLKISPMKWLALAAFPLLFIFSGGWSWVLAVFSIGASSALLKLKVFFAGFLLSFFLGSRWMSLAIATLAFAFLFPPSEGHWSSALSWALLMDGVLMGSFCSPFKGYQRVLFVTAPKARFFVVSALAWTLGVFLSTIGSPAPVSWAALIIVLWGYSELLRGHKAPQLQHDQPL